MNVMISQPMRGKTNEQIREERKELIKILEDKGHKVIDTILAKETPNGNDEAINCLSKSIEILGTVDAVVFMPGWQQSRGCVIEHEVACAYGKFVMYV